MVRIRNERNIDVASISDVTRAAFKDDPHGDHNEHRIVEALRNAKRLTVSLVAEEDNKVVGHVAISPVTISDGSTEWYGLGPISVLPDKQRQGIETNLMYAALSQLKELGASGCVLVGEPQFYARFGFKPAESLNFPGIPPEYFQMIAFGAGNPQGDVIYHSSFYSA